MAQCQGWKLPSFLSVRGAPQLLGATWTQRKNVHVCLTLQIALLGAPTHSALGLVETGHDHGGFCDKEDKGEISPVAHTFVVAPSPAWVPGQSPATCEASGHGTSVLVKRWGRRFIFLTSLLTAFSAPLGFTNTFHLQPCYVCVQLNFKIILRTDLV